MEGKIVRIHGNAKIQNLIKIQKNMSLLQTEPYLKIKTIVTISSENFVNI